MSALPFRSYPLPARVSSTWTGPLLSLGIAFASAGCVSRAHYDRSLADAATAKAAADAKEKEDEVRIQQLTRNVAEAQAATQNLETKLSELSTSDHNMQSKLDEATAINQQLRDELARLGQDVDKILADRGTLSKALEDAKGRLEELRKAQAAAQTRTDLFRDFERRFKPLEDAGQIRVEARRGELAMEVDGDLLFEPLKSELRTAGKGALMEIAHALQATSPPSSGRRFLVTANVDPPDAKDAKARRPKSAWELTALRSVAVVEALVSFGVQATALTAAAAGPFDAVVPNDTPAGRARNRRVEIALLPSASEATLIQAPK